MAATPDDGDGPAAPITADEEAQALAERMVDARDVMAEMLEETIASAQRGQIRESGRTVCGGEEVREPVARFGESVELSSCPLDTTGIWHTHPTKFGMTKPVHSLPDWGNVVFHEVDASVVVGTQSAEVVVAAANPEAARDTFRNALGIDARTTEDVVGAIRAGTINSPTAARKRVRTELSPLVNRVPMSFPDIAMRAEGLSIPARDAIHACGAVADLADQEEEHEAEHVRREGVAHPDIPADFGQRSMGLHRRAKDVTPVAAPSTEGISVSEIAIGQIIGTIAGTLTNRVLFGE